MPFLNSSNNNHSGFTIPIFRSKPHEKQFDQNFTPNRDFNANVIYTTENRSHNQTARVHADHLNETENAFKFHNTQNMDLHSSALFTPSHLQSKGSFYTAESLKTPVLNTNSVLAATSFYSAYLAANRNSPYLPYLHALAQQHSQLNMIEQQQHTLAMGPSPVYLTGNFSANTDRLKISGKTKINLEPNSRSRSRSRSPIHHSKRVKTKKVELEESTDPNGTVKNEADIIKSENEPLDLSIKSAIRNAEGSSSSQATRNSNVKRKLNAEDQFEIKKKRLSSTCFTVDQILSSNTNTQLQPKAKELANVHLHLNISPKSVIVSSFSPASSSTSPLSSVSCPASSSLVDSNEKIFCNLPATKLSKCDCLVQHLSTHSKIFKGDFLLIYQLVVVEKTL